MAEVQQARQSGAQWWWPCVKEAAEMAAAREIGSAGLAWRRYGGGDCGDGTIWEDGKDRSRGISGIQVDLIRVVGGVVRIGGAERFDDWQTTGVCWQNI
uniref:Uncharacterized protein n=1 Tax=Aegilops tauschii TaxID=37682 RepID=M8BX35_AEGTA